MGDATEGDGPCCLGVLLLAALAGAVDRGLEGLDGDEGRRVEGRGGHVEAQGTLGRRIGQLDHLAVLWVRFVLAKMVLSLSLFFFLLFLALQSWEMGYDLLEIHLWFREGSKVL